MTTLIIEATDRSPHVAFDFAEGLWSMSGESYPEDSAAFFGPVLTQAQDNLSGEEGPAITLDVTLIYFNSSSAKALMTLFQYLEGAAKRGRSVTINWRFDADDDAMQEFGEDFAEDFQSATFNLCPGA